MTMRRTLTDDPVEAADHVEPFRTRPTVTVSGWFEESIEPMAGKWLGACPPAVSVVRRRWLDVLASPKASQPRVGFLGPRLD